MHYSSENANYSVITPHHRHLQSELLVQDFTAAILRKITDERIRNLILDLGNVDGISARFIDTLTVIRSQLDALVLCNLRSGVQEALSTSPTGESFRATTTREQAIQLLMQAS